MISLEYPTEQIALIKILNEANKNEITFQMVDDLKEAFKTIEKNEALKVVVLVGHEKYFMNGLQKDNLLKYVESIHKVDPSPVFSLPLECKIPTIAAMEGSAMGPGLCFGLFADIVILSEESKYSATFMSFGYTPGDGATYILPKKLGGALAQEMLFTAGFYKGKDIKARGAGILVIKKEDVVSTAISMAKGLAVYPRTSLMLLKEHMAKVARNELPPFYENESKMQEITFGLPEVQNLIKMYMK